MSWGLEIGEEYDYQDLVDEMLGEEVMEDEYVTGNEYIVGDEYLVGARRRPVRRAMPRRRPVRRAVSRRRPAMTAMTAAIANRRANEGVLVQQKTPSKGRALFMGLDSAVNIAAGATAIVTDRPQKLFRPERLAVPSSIAPLFILNSLNIGTVNQFVSNTAVPCETFQEGGVGVGLKSDTAHPGLDISANVTNISGGAARFRATIFGSSVE